MIKSKEAIFIHLPNSLCNKLPKILFYILISCLIQGYVTGEHGIEKRNCSHLYPEELDLSLIPDVELLPSICPKTIAYLECEENLLIRENLDLDPVFIGIKDVVTGICENDSRFQKDFIASADCFRQFEINMPHCYEAAQRMYLDYRLFITRFDAEDEETGYNEEEDKDDSITFKEPHCMMSAYAIGCLGSKILDTCGQTAQNTFLEIIQRSKVLTEYCPEEEKEKLRSEFLDFLKFEKEHSHISIFSNVFDFKRKK